MQLIDTHAHLTDPSLFGQLDAVLDAAAQAGVGHIISMACDPDDAVSAIQLAHAHQCISATVGIHPHQAAAVAPDAVDRVASLSRRDGVVAIGEIGLDYFYDFADRESQLRVFSSQLEVAQGRQLPLVIHCREALDDCIRLLSRYGFESAAVVFHCFSGSAVDAERIADCGWRISFTGMVTFKKLTELQQVAAAYPPERMMIETDSPYLSPVPVRHVRPNQPAHLRHTAAFLAALRGETLEAFAELTTDNARRFFQLPASD